MTAPERIWAWPSTDAGWAFGMCSDTIVGPLTSAGYIRHDAEALAASPVVRDMIRQAFIAGFMASGEGWNGEYPCHGDKGRDREKWLTDEAAKHAAAIRARKGE